MLPSWIIAEVERRRREQEREAEERRRGVRVELPEVPSAPERLLPGPGATVIVIEIG